MDNARLQNFGLRLEGVTKAYGDLTALAPANLEVPAGKFVSILGPSGCGKSTTLMLIAGIETPDAGRIFLEGRDITRVPVIDRKVGIVFQNYALFPNLTVAQNILYALDAKGASKAQKDATLAEMLELTGLEAFTERLPHELSGGQQQRVAVARALAGRPKVLLLDEPLSALDAWSRSAIGEQLRSIQQKSGVTTVMVTHDRSEALLLSDYIVVINRGHIEQAAVPAEIYDRPATEFVATFVGGMNILRLAEVNGGRPTGIRYADVRVTKASESALSQPYARVGEVREVLFMGDSLRVTLLLNDFASVITADVRRAGLDGALFTPGALVCVTFPPEGWRLWGEEK